MKSSRLKSSCASNDKARVDLWLREMEKLEEFRGKYRKELEAKITLLYAAKDQKHNNALVLSDVLKTRKP